MLKRWLHKRMSAFERHYDYDMRYAHDMLDISRPAFFKFWRAARLAQSPDVAPRSALFAAKLVATMIEDCGPCTQLVVKMAEEAGVSAQNLRAIISGDEKSMDEDVRLGWRFARATLAHDASADQLRKEIVKRWGTQAVVALALSIAGARIFPTIKYAMGYGKSCQRVRVGDVDLRPMTNYAQHLAA
ncbi:MAG TPA: hypothetical protein VET48_06185 [Steroidobacteraceae bacterium]|nr:hypothetical protein [Steroidobacteraceae bacterium]